MVVGIYLINDQLRFLVRNYTFIDVVSNSLTVADRWKNIQKS